MYGVSEEVGTVSREPQALARSWGWGNHCQPYPEMLGAMTPDPSPFRLSESRVYTWEKA